MKKSKSKYFILGLLALLFMAPGLAALLFYKHPAWLIAAGTNKGALFNPPLKLNSLNGQATPPKWQLVFLNSGPCEQVCLQQVAQIAKIRLALGRKLYRVEQRLILDEEGVATLSPHLQEELKAQDIQVSSLAQAERLQLRKLASERSVFIANPEHYLILSYSAEAKPNDIYQDLKHLLQTDELKNG